MDLAHLLLGAALFGCVVTIAILALKLQRSKKRQLMTLMEKPIDSALQTQRTPSRKLDINPRLVGLIVEPREHPNLIPVIENFMERLPGVPVYVVHGTKNESMLKERFGESLIYYNLGIENMKIQQYSYLMTRPNLYEMIQGEHILVFQTDSVLFLNSKVDLQEFLAFDYVGAPWKHRESGGNGGLSLRRRSMMIRATKEYPYSGEPEDVYFCNALVSLGASFPPKEHAIRFSFETIEGTQLPFGAHKNLPKSQKLRALITHKEMAIMLPGK